MLKQLNKLLIVLISLLLFGCSSATQQTSNNSSNVERYYLTRILFSDSSGNYLGFYNSEKIGSEDSYIEIDGEKVKFCYYYQRNEEFTKNGSLDSESGTILLEGDGTEYLLTNDENGIYLTYNYRDDIWSSFYFTKEKSEKYEGELDEIYIEAKSDFEESDFYQTIIDNINSKLKDIDHKIEYKYGKLYVDFTISSSISNAIKTSSNHDDFDSICNTLTNVSTSFSSAIHVGGYKQINCISRLVCEDDNEILFSVENGEVEYKFSDFKIPDNQQSNNYSKNDTYDYGNSYSSSNRFEDSDVYKEIKQTMTSSFREYSPKLEYSESKKTLTCSMRAPNGVHTALDNGAKNVISAWIDYTLDLDNVSSAGYDKLCENGYSDIAFIIMVSSDKDTSKCLFATMNGVEYYNVLYD